MTARTLPTHRLTDEAKPAYTGFDLGHLVTAKAVGGAKAPIEGETPPKDYAHIRVGPAFESKVAGRCIACQGPTRGTQCAMVENTKTEKKRAIHEECLQQQPDLLARRDSGDIDSFLA